MTTQPIPYPLVNGVRRDFSSITLNFAGRQFVGFTAINYEDSLEPGEVFGASAQMIGLTRGQRKIEASVTMFHAEWEDLRTNVLGPGFMEREFELVAIYGDDGGPVVRDSLFNCRVKRVRKNSQSGTDALSVEIELHVLDMLHNGVSPLTNPLRPPPT